MAIDFDNEDREEWARIIGLTKSELLSIDSKLANASEYPVDSASLIRLVEKAMPDRTVDKNIVSTALAKNLVRLAGLQIEGASINISLKDEISEGLSNAGISDSGIEQLSENWEFIEKISQREQFGVAYKASELIFDHEKSFIEARIITDLRPVFSTNGQTIVGSVAVNTLKIEFLQDNQLHELSISVDQKDLTQLQEIAKYAEEKTSETIRFFSAKIGSGFVASDEDGPK